MNLVIGGVDGMPLEQRDVAAAVADVAVAVRCDRRVGAVGEHAGEARRIAERRRVEAALEVGAVPEEVVVAVANGQRRRVVRHDHLVLETKWIVR